MLQTKLDADTKAFLKKLYQEIGTTRLLNSMSLPMEIQLLLHLLS
jgi:hypothetical protein